MRLGDRLDGTTFGASDCQLLEKFCQYAGTALERLGARRLALATPYLPEIQERIIANLRADGFEVVAEAHLSESENFGFSVHAPDAIGAMTRKALSDAPAAGGPDAALIVCTNFRGAPCAAGIEAETGVPVLDSVSVTAWKTLRAVGLDPARVTGWGRLFTL